MCEFVQKVRALQSSGKMKDGFRIGDMFDAFVKQNVATLFPVDVLKASTNANDAVDCLPGPQSTTHLPLEAKYIKFSPYFSSSPSSRKHPRPYYTGLTTSAQINYSTAKRYGGDKSEFELVNELLVHTLVLM